MNRKQKNANRIQRHAQQKEARRKKKDELLDEIKEQESELEEELTLDDAESQDGEESKELQKDYADTMPMPPMMEMPMGPTSWDELDAQEAAQEQAEAVREVTWDVQDLVRNILHSPMMAPEEQVSAMQAVADGFGERIATVLAQEQVQKDADLLEIESILARDGRQISALEKAQDIITLTKRTLSTQARKKLPAGEFALPDKKKYPIHDRAHVRNALARAAQQIKAGGAAAADARAALPKIRAAAKKMGIGVAKKEHSSILIEKDATGNWRWIGWPTNNFIDHSQDIMTESAHLDYVHWVNKDLAGRAPVFTSCHAPGTARTYPVDFAGYESGFVVMSGKLTEAEAMGLLELSKSADIGMSHTSWGVRSESDPRQIVQYRMFEVTDLPVETADNPFTTLETISKEADMDQLEYLTKLLGSKERAENALKMKTSLKQKELQEAGVESKEKPTTETPPAVQPPAMATTPADPKLEAIIKAVEEQFGMGQLSELITQLQEEVQKVPLLEAVIKDLQENRDNQLAEMISPPAARFSWMTKHRASESKDNVIKDEEKVKKEQPGIPAGYWLNELTNTQPVRVE